MSSQDPPTGKRHEPLTHPVESIRKRPTERSQESSEEGSSDTPGGVLDALGENPPSSGPDIRIGICADYYESKSKDQQQDPRVLFLDMTPYVVQIDLIVNLPQRTTEDEHDTFLSQLLQRTKETAERGIERQAEAHIAEPIWDMATAKWYAVDYYHFDAAASALKSADDVVHQGLGQVAHALVLPVGGEMAVAAKNILPFVPLAIDEPLERASRLLRVFGTITAFAAGQPAVAIASMKSLIRDEVTKQVTRLVSHAVVRELTLHHYRPPSPSPRRPPSPQGPGPSGPGLGDMFFH